MPLTTFVQDGERIDYTPGGDVALGAVVVQGELVGIAVAAIAAGKRGTLALAGIYDIAKATGGGTAITAGANVYWNAAGQVATTSAAGNKLIGKSVLAAADADTSVRVRLFQ
jgi:predicted RecA/RadA family phage recombinase